tara:strand:+ start:64 stop:165 length:102 start_codon:yes stop_codon:yes gene_type:complete
VFNGTMAAIAGFAAEFARRRPAAVFSSSACAAL